MKLYTFYTLVHRKDGSVVSTSDWEVYAHNVEEAQALAQTFLSKRPYSVGYQTVSKVTLVDDKEALS